MTTLGKATVIRGECGYRTQYAKGRCDRCQAPIADGAA